MARRRDVIATIPLLTCIPAGCISLTESTPSPDGCPGYEGADHRVCGESDTHGISMRMESNSIPRDGAASLVLTTTEPLTVDPEAYTYFQWKAGNWVAVESISSREPRYVSIEAGGTYSWTVHFGTPPAGPSQDDGEINLSPHSPKGHNAVVIPVRDGESLISCARRFSRP